MGTHMQGCSTTHWSLVRDRSQPEKVNGSVMLVLFGLSVVSIITCQSSEVNNTSYDGRTVVYTRAAKAPPT